ncbi:MAG: ribonuclease H-like domain-containing protein [bacterium]
MNLKEKLRQLESLPHLKGSIEYQTPQLSSDNQLDKVINGNYEDSPYGLCFCRYKKFPLDYIHGIAKISSYLEKSSALLSLVGKSTDFDGAVLGRTAFIDAETTGLSGGSGICAFLVGVGYFTEDSFCITQYFMTDFNEEKALLHQINRLIENYDIVVSYNGKCFDFPLLLSRNVYHRLKTPLSNTLHLDLLFTVRRLWKHRLPDCTLGTAESQILKASRDGDVPGYLIPEMYFEYLRSKDANPLKAIFYHNQQDVLTLVALAAKACQVFENPEHETDCFDDILKLGKVYEGLSQFNNSLALYNQFESTACGRTNRRELLFRIAFNYKKLRNWAKASEVWEQYISIEKFHPVPYIELAKHYEHRKKDYYRARLFVETALKEIKILEELNGKFEWANYKNDLEYRRKRLIKKSERANLYKTSIFDSS